MSAVASLASSIVNLNLIIVNVAFTAMSTNLDASLGTIQWVATAYVLGLMSTVPLTGWASGRLGLKRLMLLSLFFFLVASALCGFAWSVDSLVAFRILAGFAGGVIPPLTHSIVVRASAGRRLASVMSVLNTPALAVPVFAPTLGGALVGGLGWRWVFLVSVPLTAAALLACARVIPADEPEEREPLDRLGVVLLPLGLVLLVYGLSQFGHAAGTAAVAAGIALTLAFAVNAHRRRSSSLLDIGLFRRRSFVVPAAIAVLFSFMLFGSAAVLPLYFESARGHSAAAAGVFVALQGIGSLIGVVACGRLSRGVSERTMALGSAALILVGTVPWIGLSPRTGTAALLVGLLLRGAGLSALMNSAYAVAYGTLEAAALPGATAALNIVSRVSAAAGVAIAVIVVERRAPDLVHAGAARSTAVAAAFGDAFLLFGVLAALAIAATAVLPAGRAGSRIAPALT